MRPGKSLCLAALPAGLSTLRVQRRPHQGTRNPLCDEMLLVDLTQGHTPLFQFAAALLPSQLRAGSNRPALAPARADRYDSRTNVRSRNDGAAQHPALQRSSAALSLALGPDDMGAGSAAWMAATTRAVTGGKGWSWTAAWRIVGAVRNLTSIPAAFHLLVLATAASCAAPAADADGRWFGTLDPAPAKPGCSTSRASLVLRRGTVQFNPDESTWTLEGSAAPDGSLVAARSSLGANKQTFATSFSGRVTPDGIIGAYTTPRCTFTAKLQPP